MYFLSESLDPYILACDFAGYFEIRIFLCRFNPEFQQEINRKDGDKENEPNLGTGWMGWREAENVSVGVHNI